VGVSHSCVQVVGEATGGCLWRWHRARAANGLVGTDSVRMRGQLHTIGKRVMGYIMGRMRAGWGEVAGDSVELVPGDVGGGVKET
jgi:hypothetical protein